MNLEQKYPFIASWIRDGRIHIGQMEDREPWAAIIDPGSLDTLFDAIEEYTIGRSCLQPGLELKVSIASKNW